MNRGPVLFALLCLATAARADSPPGPRFPILPQDKAWATLPAPAEGAGQPLPAWARVTARTLPRSTAIILELDDLHRTKNPLDPKVRAMVRWVVADALKCDASKAVALADLKAAGGTDADVKALTASRTDLPVDVQRLLSVTRQLTLEAYKITDAQMAAVRTDLGDPKLVAWVQLVGFANFQDRMLLSFGLADDPAGAMPAKGVRFKRPWEGGAEPPKREAVKAGPSDPKPATVDDPAWRALAFDALQKEMDAQRARQPRVSVPTFEDVKPFLAKDARPLRIKWSLVCMGHSPVLAAPWGGMLRSFAEESKQDRVFEELLFWIITRESQCFY